MPKACHHHKEINDNKPLRLFSNPRFVSEVFWLTREHVFLIGAPEVGRSQAARCLVEEVLAAEVKVHCVTKVLLFASCFDHELSPRLCQVGCGNLCNAVYVYPMLLAPPVSI